MAQNKDPQHRLHKSKAGKDLCYFGPLFGWTTEIQVAHWFDGVFETYFKSNRLKFRYIQNRIILK